MSCKCANRMRGILRLAKYELNDGVWEKEGRDPIPDSRVEEHHFKTLIETMHIETMSSKAVNFIKRTKRA